MKLILQLANGDTITINLKVFAFIAFATMIVSSIVANFLLSLRAARIIVEDAAKRNMDVLSMNSAGLFLRIKHKVSNVQSLWRVILKDGGGRRFELYAVHGDYYFGSIVNKIRYSEIKEAFDDEELDPR